MSKIYFKKKYWTTPSNCTKKNNSIYFLFKSNFILKISDFVELEKEIPVDIKKKKKMIKILIHGKVGILLI